MASTQPMIEKMRGAAPYNIFYNKIPGLPTAESPNLISFRDVLCPSLGALKCSLHIVSRVDFAWLTKQYDKMNVGNTPLTVVYSEEVTVDGACSEVVGDVTRHQLSPMEGEVKCNRHEKVSIYVYRDGSLRVVVGTGNLYQSQWEHYSHGIWMSPLCRPLTDEVSGESPTNFKSDLLKFLHRYDLSVLDSYIDHVERADFSDVSVFLVTSRPGYYQPDDPELPLNRMKTLIKEHSLLMPNEEPVWSLVAQASNMGKFGHSPEEWLTTYFLEKLVTTGIANPSRFATATMRTNPAMFPNSSRLANIKLVFPTWLQVKKGFFDSELVGTGIRYTRSVHNGQKWLNDYLHRWHAKKLQIGGQIVLPHTKTYCRMSPCSKKMAWFLITSSNVNRGAWGIVWQSKDGTNNGKVYVRNSEAGVMFFPKLFKEQYFRIGEQSEGSDRSVFPLLYDVPLKKYSEKDHPWTIFEGPWTRRK